MGPEIALNPYTAPVSVQTRSHMHLLGDGVAAPGAVDHAQLHDVVAAGRERGRAALGARGKPGARRVPGVARDRAVGVARGGDERDGFADVRVRWEPGEGRARPGRR